MKAFVSQAKSALREAIFGSPELPQFCSLGLRDPQSEIQVWLCGVGAPRDVSARNVVAAAKPFTIGIGLERAWGEAELLRARPTLEFRERGGSCLLGRIGLRWVEQIPLENEQLCLFRTSMPRNYCAPKNQVWRRYLYFAYQQWRAGRRNALEIRMIARELHALFVFYICPRPVALVSVSCGCGDRGNIFPMDLIGPVGAQHFSLALHATGKALALIERSRRIALSSVPIEQMPVAYRLGTNHRESSIPWASIPIAMAPSPTFGLPVPKFATRVREIEVEEVRPLGSHTFFVGKVVHDQAWSEGLQFFQAHGFYEKWRQQAIVPPAR